MLGLWCWFCNVLVLLSLTDNAKCQSKVKNEGVSEGGLVCCCWSARQGCHFGILDKVLTENPKQGRSMVLFV